MWATVHTSHTKNGRWNGQENEANESILLALGIYSQTTTVIDVRSYLEKILRPTLKYQGDPCVHPYWSLGKPDVGSSSCDGHVMYQDLQAGTGHYLPGGVLRLTLNPNPLNPTS